MYGTWFTRAILNGGVSAEAAAVMPAGALGIWYASDYDAATNAVPNAELSNTPVANIFRGSRNMFAQTEIWTPQSITATDAAATGPDGTSSASTLVGTGNWYLSNKAAVTLDAGTYTVAANVKRNTGSDQSFAFSGDNTATRSSTKTATSAWQRFSYTFTRETTFGSHTVLLCSIDGSTAANLQVCDYELFAGSSDLGPIGSDGNLYLGFASTSASPTVASNAIDLTGQGFGFISLPENQTITNVTAMAVVSKTAAGSSYQAFLSKATGYQDFSAMAELGGKPYTFLGGNSEMDLFSGMWNLLDVGYHMITHRYNGTARQVWLDDILLFTADASISSYSLREMLVGIVNTPTLYSGLKINSIALYGSSLTDDEVRTAYEVLSANATTDGLTMADARVLVAEGDSITAGSSDAPYPHLYGANANPKFLGSNVAVSGSAITDLESRAAVVDAIIPPTPGSRDFILTVLIGRNDLVSLGTSAFLANLASYCDDRRTAGWTVVVCTLLPSTAADFNTARNTVNTAINATWVGLHCDAICDFAADATMGPDAAASNATYYSDGTHPTAAGQALLEAVYRATINAL